MEKIICQDCYITTDQLPKNSFQIREIEILDSDEVIKEWLCLNCSRIRDLQKSLKELWKMYYIGE